MSSNAPLNFDMVDSASATAAWQAFVSSQSEQEFYASWLGVLCHNHREIVTAAVLLRLPGDAAFVPVALWPLLPRDLSFLGAIVEQAINSKVGVVLACEVEATNNARYHAAIPLVDSTGAYGAVVMELATLSDSDSQRLLRHVHWALGWLFEWMGRRRLVETQQHLGRISSVTETLAAAMRDVPLQQSLFDVVNEVTRYLHGSRTAIGLVKRGRIRPIAISDAAHFERDTDLMAHYSAAMQESLDAMETIVCVVGEHDPEPAVRHPAHIELAKFCNARCVMSAPLVLDAQPLGVLTVERDAGSPFGSSEIDWLNAVAALLPAVIDLKKVAQRDLLAHLFDNLRLLAQRIAGPRYLVWKFSTFASIVVMALMCLPINYRVTAKIVIEGEVQQSMVAPFASYVMTSQVRAGDTVKKGQVLCELDDRELKLERDKWRGEREQHSRELQQAMASSDLPNVQIYDAQLRQAEAQLHLADQQLELSKLRAPFDGIVISGDLSQLIGSPVEQGKKLFDIAPLDNYRVILEVDESEIKHVSASQHGALLVAGVTNEPLRFVVSKVTPVATAKDSRNYFRVEAKLDHTVPTLRPGMEGVGKVEVGKRRLWWITSHGFTDWLQLSLWRWLP